MFGASELGTYVNATRHRSKGNTKRLICRSFYYSPGLTFTRGSTSQTTDGVSTALTVFSSLFLSPTLFLFSLRFFSYPIHPTPFFPHGKQGFLTRRRKSRDARFRSKSKSLSTVPNIFTLDVVSAISGRHRLCVLLDDVEIVLLDVATK